MDKLGVATITLLLFGALSTMPGCNYTNHSVMPRHTDRDLYTYYKTQDTRPDGKVGLFITGLIMPETLEQDPDFFYQASKKLNNIVPPFVYKKMLQATGIVLLDPARYHEANEFVPTSLEDVNGSAIDIDGVPYIDKYRAGLMQWVDGKKDTGYGYFLLTERKGDWPDLVQKSTNHARLWYYGDGLLQEGLPHEKGVSDAVMGGVNRILKKHGAIPYKFNNAESPEIKKADMFDLLDSGVDTVVLVSTQVIFSNFEAFKSSFVHAFDYIEQWRADNGNKPVKVIIAPPIGHQPGMRKAYTEMVNDRLAQLPSQATVKLLLTSHGMDWKANPDEPYLQEESKYTTPLRADLEALARRYNFKRVDIEQAQDVYAGDDVDPDQQYLSTNEGYWQAIREGYDYVVSVPITFYAENSDTLFGHAVENYRGFPGYDLYQRIDYPDWNVPFTRSFTVNNTTIIYNGVPVGPYAIHIADAYYTSMDAILSQR